jgi:septum formation protein
MLDHLKNKKIILASKSPRRQELLKGAGISFSVITRDTNEDFPETLREEEIARFLAEKKAGAMIDLLDENTIIITADTIVCINGQVLNKPVDKNDAVRMLNILSGNMHYVHTGVCLYSQNRKITFHETTKVFFKDLDEDEIEYYIETHRPFDKAGSYGVQEWMGYVGMKRIEGCFFNVMGLPMHSLYENLKNWV